MKKIDTLKTTLGAAALVISVIGTASISHSATVTPPHAPRGNCTNCHGSKYGTNGTTGTTSSVVTPSAPSAPTSTRTVTPPHAPRGNCTNCHGTKYGSGGGTTTTAPAQLGPKGNGHGYGRGGRFGQRG